MAWEYDGKPFSGVGTRPWLGPKFWCPGMQNTADFSNQKVFRYADAILMMAECYAETEDSDEAVRYLNMVRERAGTTAYVFKNKDALLEEIQKERGRELLGEFQRKFDLVRWGIWYQMTLRIHQLPDAQGQHAPLPRILPRSPTRRSSIRAAHSTTRPITNTACKADGTNKKTQR